MSGSSDFKRWAEAAHRESLQVGKPKKNKNPRFTCQSCRARTTKNQINSNGGVCHACKTPFPIVTKTIRELHGNRL